MNKKGFTLVELLAVIVIIAVVITLIFPAVTNVINQSKKTVRDVQINKILDAAYDYTLKNTDFLPENGYTKYITLNQLKKENLIDADIREATTNKQFADDLIISIKQSNSKVSNKNSKKHGNFVYTVELDFMNTTEFISNKPEIKFSGYDTNPIVVNLNLGDGYTPLTYEAKSKDGTDLTDLVIENIVYNSKNSSEVDTSIAGIYYITYSVVDNNGYSNHSVVSVIVLDNEKPMLTIPENITISSSLNNYDLMEGTTCKDNSGDCDIKIIGDIEFGEPGKYVIEYKAVDPSGNTTISKRVITVQ